MAIYFASAVGTDRVKIGYADDVDARLPGIATGCPFPLKVLRVIGGTPATERWLHRHFADRHVHLEWFLFCDEMLTIEPPHLVDAPDSMPPLLRTACEAAGGLVALARFLSITPQAVFQWKQVPATRVLAVERATNARVTRYQLRPDLFGEQPEHGSAA